MMERQQVWPARVEQALREMAGLPWRVYHGCIRCYDVCPVSALGNRNPRAVTRVPYLPNSLFDSPVGWVVDSRAVPELTHQIAVEIALAADAPRSKHRAHLRHLLGIGPAR